MPITPRGVRSPDDSDDYDLVTDLAAMGVSIDAALDVVANQTNRRGATVANVADRTALFPSPTQGDRVFRSDAGYEETYLGTYNVGTNPGGASVAGWYPTRRMFVASRTGTQTIGAAGFFQITSAMTQTRNDGLGTYSGGAFTVTASGIYMLSANYYLTAESAVLGLEISRNNASPNLGPIVQSFIRGASLGTSVSTISQLNAGDVIRVIGYTSLSNSIDTAGTRGAGLSLARL